MCTVSIIADRGGYRLVTNRDVSRDRARARFPHRLGREAVGPIDPDGGGTWVAARPGLTLCILNGNPDIPPPPPPAPASRGLIIPALIDGPDADAAIDALRALDLARYPPFRLLAVGRAGGVRIIDARWDGRELLRGDDAGPPPAVFVSSGLGDATVACRVPLFEEMVVARGASPAAQDAFHRHRWPGRGAVSVLMSRDAARTVSITEVSDTDDGIEVRHHPVDELARG